MGPELWLRPVQVPDEALQRVQLPEQLLAGGAAVSGKLKILVREANVIVWRYRSSWSLISTEQVSYETVGRVGQSR